MDEADLAALVEIGEQLFTFKLFLAAVHLLWIYDYCLTFGDEVEYAWRGRKSRMFALFIANRYNPVLQIVWSSVAMYHYTYSLCEGSKWLGIFHSTVSTLLAKTTIALRVYAVTDRNKWLGGTLSGLIIAQLIIGIYMIVSAAVLPMQQLPDINLDPFKLCTTTWSKPQELLFVNVGIAFEVLVFSAIFVAARKPKHGRHPGIPSLLDAIWRDATQYFLLIALCELTSDLFIIFAPVSISVLPGMASTMLIPLMASRLMLSLKKAAVEPARMHTISITANPNPRLSVISMSMRFSSRVPGGLPEVSGTPVSQRFFEEDVEDVELGSVPQTPRKDGYGYQVNDISATSDDFLVGKIGVGP